MEITRSSSHQHGVDRHAEVVVVGARCAGAATALLLARAGHDVVVVDRSDLAGDTLSTHALARGGVLQLDRWGLLDEVVAGGAPPIRQVLRGAGSGEQVREIDTKAGVDHLLAPRRQAFDPLLAAAAAAAGADLRLKTRVTSLDRDDTGRVTGVSILDPDGGEERISAEVVIGADGLRSRVARAVEAPIVEQRPSASSCHYAYYEGFDPHRFEFHVGDAGFAGVFPTNDGLANVWVCVPAERADRVLSAGRRQRAASHETLLDEVSPALAGRARQRRRATGVRGGVRFPIQARRAAGRGWALVGDAAFHQDPMTGHGMTDALRDAELLAGAVHGALTAGADLDEALACYDRDRREASAPFLELAAALTCHPPAEEFTALLKRLAKENDREAEWLAARPSLPELAPAPT